MTKVEFLIVGQGLVGSLLAFEMRQNNIDFRIISSSQKSKSSLVAAGMINPLVFKRLTKSWMVDSFMPVMKETYLNLEQLLGEQFFYEKKILKPLNEQEEKLWQERKGKNEFEKYIFSIGKETNIKGIKKSFAHGIVDGSGYVDLNVFLNASERFFRANNLILI